MQSMAARRDNKRASPEPGISDPREVRLLVKVARLYHERGLGQAEIAAQMELSQATVSRLLKRALAEQIVRVTVRVPSGTCTELEDGLQERFGLRDAVVVQGQGSPGDPLREVAAAAAFYLETTLKPRSVIGVSSWSASWLAAVEAMHPVSGIAGVRVVQTIGGAGHAPAALHATRLTQRLAQLVNGEPILLPAPGIVGNPETKRVLLRDPYIRGTLALLDEITVAVVGVGSLEPSALLTATGNAFGAKEREVLRKAGAVGEIFLQFFDGDGKPVRTPLDDRVIGMSLAQLARVGTIIAAVTGAGKLAALRGALRGKLINVLVTDRALAEALLKG